ncbi:putative chromosome-partitioning protein ParB [bacterium BMS3Bbin07]|nr:putative chromosome-partitioning protein ParB [bacterium BMS3Bbin07]
MKDALGRGLGALIPDRRQGVQEIEIKKIKPNPEQPRKVFNDQALRELTASIKEKGILQPVMVRRAENGDYYLIAGERRWRAAALSGLKKIPAMIKESGPGESLELALIENIQRDDLNPIETADAFHRLMEEHKYTQEDLSKKVGKERATIANYLRLLRLPPEVKGLINDGRLSMGHAKAIVSLPTKKAQMGASRAVVKKGLSVRETEALCKRLMENPSGQTKKQKAKDPDIAALEERLKQSMGTKVQIKHRGKAGKIEIEYYSLDELDRLLEILRA